MPLIVTFLDLESQIDVLIKDDDIEAVGNPTGWGGDHLLRPYLNDNNKLRHMNTLLVLLKQDDSYLRSESWIIHERHEQLLTVVNRNITHMMRNPVNII